VVGAEQVVLPSGAVVWVQARAGGGSAAGDGGPDGDGPQDVGLAESVAQLALVPGFVETVQGVVESVRLALARHPPESVTVEFGLEISGKTGAVLSLLGEAGGGAHVKISASWGGHGSEQ
jgi:Trypsin-co-occurring domain 1